MYWISNDFAQLQLSMVLLFWTNTFERGETGCYADYQLHSNLVVQATSTSLPCFKQCSTITHTRLKGKLRCVFGCNLHRPTQDMVCFCNLKL